MDNSMMKTSFRQVALVCVAVFCSTAASLTADDLRIVLTVGETNIPLGEGIPFTAQYSTDGDSPLEMTDPRLSGATITARQDTELFGCWVGDLGAGCAGFDELNKVASRRIHSGIPLPRVSITPDKPFRTTGELKFRLHPECCLMPGHWNLRIEDQLRHIKSDSVEVCILIGRRSVPFIAKIVCDTKVPQYQRRRWAQFLELVDSDFNPIWPRPKDTAEVRAEKDAKIADEVESLLRKWNALSDELVDKRLETINLHAEEVTHGIYSQ